MKYIYYKNDGTIVAVMKTPHSEYENYECLETEVDEIFVDGYTTKIENGVISRSKIVKTFEQEEQENKSLIYSLIAELKQELASTDYQAIKYAEGWLSEEEYAPIKEHRQSIRVRINELEQQL